MNTLPERMRYARSLKSWTQADLAKAAGVSNGTIGNIEAGNRQSKGSIPQIAEALGVNFNWLSKGVGEVAGGALSLTAHRNTQQTKEPAQMTFKDFMFCLNLIDQDLQKIARQAVIDCLSGKASIDETSAILSKLPKGKSADIGNNKAA